MPRGTSRLDEARQQGRLWTPANLTVKSYAWYDGQDISAISAASGLVSQWRDRSENGRHLAQATAGDKPTYSVDGFKQRPSIFNSVSTSIGTTSFGLSGSTASFFMMQLATLDNSLADNRMLSMAATANNDFDNALGGLIIQYGGTVFTFNANGADRGTQTPLPSPGLVEVILNGTTCVNGADGTFTASTNYTPSFNIDSIAVGGYFLNNGLTPWTGYFGEVLILNYAPSTADRQRIEGYCCHRRGLSQNLPASHPYRNAPPLIGA